MSTRNPASGATKENPPPDLSMSWQSYIVPVIASGTLMITAWSVGHYGLSVLWIFLLVILYVLKTHVWIKREQKRTRLRNVIMREKDTVMASLCSLDDLPAWVQFPDTDRVEWVNKIILQLWPYIGEYTKFFLREFIEPQVRSQMPSPFKSFKFIGVDMGDLPFRVGGLKVYTSNVGRDRIIVDMDVVYAGDAEFTVESCRFVGGLNQLTLSGKIRCVLQPLLPYPPMIGGLACSFIELPKFDFTLTGMGQFVQLPGLIDAIKGVINSQMANMAVLPNKVVVPLVPNLDLTRLYFPEPDGVVRIKIIGARDLENKDISILRKDKSDPYAVVQIGSQISKTKTINNNLNPTFNECFEAIVDQASGQQLRIELFDEDMAGADEELGRMSVRMDDIRREGEIDRWIPLEGCKSGELHLHAVWLNLSTNPSNIEREAWEKEWLNSNKPLHSALVMIFIDSVADLPYPKSNLEPSAFVELTLGRVAQRTPVKPKTTNPLYQSKHFFFVNQPDVQELKIKAIDDGTRRELGDITIPLSSIMKEPKMELFQRSLQLVHGVHSSTMVVTIRLRTFGPNAEPYLIHSTYGNATHIERANGKAEPAQSNSSTQRNGSVTMAAASTEPGKTVNKADERAAVGEIRLESGNIPALKEITRSLSSITDLSSVTPSARHSRTSSFLSRLRMGKHAKRRKQSNVPLGQLQVGMRYDPDNFKLTVDIISAKDLYPLREDGECESYVSAKLIPVTENTMPKGNLKRKTPVRTSTNPIFDSHIDFDMTESDLHNYKLRLRVKDATNHGLLSKKQVFGMVEIPLQNFNSDDEQNGPRWLNLEASH